MPVSAGRSLRIADLISRARAHGCEVRVSRSRLETPYGWKNIRYIYCPHSGRRFDITDYDDNEFMLASEIEAAERRLAIKLIP